MSKFHYFVSHGMGFAVGETLDEAMSKAFCTTYYGDMGKWQRNIQKEGRAGIPVFTCRVPLAADAPYEIEWFCPKVEGLTERKNMVVTYVTQKKVVWMRDPEDRVRELEHKLGGFEKEKHAYE